MKFAAMAGSLLLGAAPVLAQVPAPAPKAASKQSDVDKVVCHREEEIGSRLNAKKVCMTVHDWVERQQEHRDEVDQLQRDSAVPSGH